MEEKKRKTVGALWQKTDKNGKKYFSGQFEIDDTTHKVVVFSNGYKTQEKHPDFVIYPSTPQEPRASVDTASDEPI